MCRGYFLISVAEIRYKHDLVRLCHKFHFCPFQMKIPHIDEEKELYCVSYRGLCLRFFVLRVRGSRSQKMFGATQRLRASRTCLFNSIGIYLLNNIYYRSAVRMSLHHVIFIFARRVEIRQSYDLLRNIDLRVL